MKSLLLVGKDMGEGTWDNMGCEGIRRQETKGWKVGDYN